MNTYGVSCSILFTIEAESPEEAEDYARVMLDDEHFFSDYFNDIEATLLHVGGEN